MMETLSQEEFEKIERYLLNKLTTEEREAFEQRLETDPSLKEKVEVIQLQIEAVESISKSAVLENIHSQMNEEPKKVKSLDIPFLKRKSWSVAASVIALLGIATVFYLMNKTSSDDVYAEYFQPDAGLITPMGSSENYEFFRGMVDYKQGNYDKAIARWKEQWTHKRDNDSLNYYIGVSLMARELTVEAIPYLAAVESFSESTFIPDVYYYRALAELREGNLDIAKEYLEKSGSKKAKEILILIKN